MSSIIPLNQEEEDCLQELINISFGKAIGAIEKILHEYATLQVPQIKSVSNEELHNYFTEKISNEGKHYISKQTIEGKLSGENIYIVDHNSAINLAKSFGVSDFELNEHEIKDAILDIANILVSTTVTKLASLIETTIMLSPPSLDVIDSAKDLEKKYETEFKRVILISTQSTFRGKEIFGELIIITNKESFDFLKASLNKIIDEY